MLRFFVQCHNKYVFYRLTFLAMTKSSDFDNSGWLARVGFRLSIFVPCYLLPLGATALLHNDTSHGDQDGFESRNYSL